MTETKPTKRKRQPSSWHFCKEEPRCPEPCTECWRTLDGRQLATREEMLRDPDRSWSMAAFDT